MTGARWSTLHVQVEPPVVRIRLDRPDAHNAANTEMVEELHAVLTGIARDETASVVVLTGTGSMFCPGADLRNAGSARLPELAVYQSATLLHEMPQLTVAAVNGGCAGPGFAWATACDLRVASDRARFSTAFLQVGLAGELGLPWTLSRAIGGARARDLCFLPRKLDAQELYRAGLLARVLPGERFTEELDALVHELGSRSPSAVRAMKANFVLAERTDLAGFVEQEALQHQQLFTSGSAGT